MDNQKKYITIINKIFECTEILKKGYNNIDNLNYISEIEEFNNAIVDGLNEIKKVEKESEPS